MNQPRRRYSKESVYCSWAKKLLCWLRNSRRSSIRRSLCPQNNKQWLDLVYDWAKNKRDPRGLNLSSIPGTSNVSDEIMAGKADIYVKFKNPEAVADFVINLQDYNIKNITKSICKDLIYGYKIWKEVNAYIPLTHKRAKVVVGRQMKKLEKGVKDYYRKNTLKYR